jgi:predicted Fe-Mo cluster-binding NifX family protein
MKLCIPVESDLGLESCVFGHFGSAPVFLFVDLETGAIASLDNANRAHGHGQCNPLASLQGHALDGVVVGGIGRRALEKLNASGVKVFLAGAQNVAANVRAYAAGRLVEVTPSTSCSAHAQGGGKACH